MKSTWNIKPLSEIVDVRDGTHDSPKPVRKGKLLITTKHLKSSYIDFTSAYYISDVDFDLVNKRSKVDQWDILISMIGTVGNLYLEKNPANYAIKNLGLIKTSQNPIISKYIYYYLLSKQGQGLIRERLKGTTQSFLSLSELRGLPIAIPPLEELQAIAEVLSGIDDKIDLLNRQNETLEAMAQTLFRQWFIEEADDSWEEVTLGSFFPIKTGKKDANFSTVDGPYPFFTCSKNAIKAPSYSFDCAAILLAGNGDFNVKRYKGKFEAYQRTYVLSPHEPGLMNALYVIMQWFLEPITSGARGSVINFITKGMIEGFSFKYKPELLSSFALQCDLLFDKVDNNNGQISILTGIRDALLPKLMSGEVRVKLD